MVARLQAISMPKYANELPVAGHLYGPLKPEK
jgi:hypothetical protein